MIYIMIYIIIYIIYRVMCTYRQNMLRATIWAQGPDGAPTYYLPTNTHTHYTQQRLKSLHHAHKVGAGT